MECILKSRIKGRRKKLHLGWKNQAHFKATVYTWVDGQGYIFTFDLSKWCIPLCIGCLDSRCAEFFQAPASFWILEAGLLLDAAHEGHRLPTQEPFLFHFRMQSASYDSITADRWKLSVVLGDAKHDWWEWWMQSHTLRVLIVVMNLRPGRK